VTTPSLTTFWDERFRDYDLGAEHPFSERSRALAAGLLDRVANAKDPDSIEWVRSVGPASRREVESFHRTEYVDLVERASHMDEPILLDVGDTPSFPGCYEAAARIVGGAVRGLEGVWERSRPAFHPAGGLHHARPERASGFCIFNDVAVAIARAVGAGRRIAYVDIDAHHGDGVMYGFYESGHVLDIDFHQDGRTLFPGTGFPSETGAGDGSGMKVNIPLPPGSGDEALLPLFRRLVPPLLRSFRPEAIVLQHGVDGHVGDALAHLQYTPAAYAEIDRTILSLARELTHGRLLVTGGGGYRASAVSRVLARTGLLLADLEVPEDGEVPPEEWRTEYHHTIGEPAPMTWVDDERLAPSPWRRENEELLVGDLEGALGTRFPRVEPV
jgi:acetoin utilization protein AcuC